MCALRPRCSPCRRTRCSLILTPRVCPNPSSPLTSVFVSVLFAGDRIYSSCTVFPCFNSSQVFFTTNTPPPPLFLSSPRSLSYSSPSLLLPPSRRPPPLSEEIDWVIWLGASSARFLARGKERSGGDMTTCRNNNNIHNIGRVGMDGGMRRRRGESGGMEPALAHRCLLYAPV